MYIVQLLGFEDTTLKFCISRWRFSQTRFPVYSDDTQLQNFKTPENQRKICRYVDFTQGAVVRLVHAGSPIIFR